MRHFPVFLNLDGRRVIVSGAGETAVAKLRLLLKTRARINVFGADADTQVKAWAAEGKIHLVNRPLREGDALCAAMVYAANDDAIEDARVAKIGRDCFALVNIVDNLEDSAFITPAIVDRDPLTIAIGTEGAAPVLARKIKADLEERLPASLGTLARIGQAFRKRAAMIPRGPARRRFWSRYYGGAGAKALATGGESAVRDTLETLLTDTIERRPRDGRVSFVGAGPGDPDLLTMKARRTLHEADVVLHDQLVPLKILELARREAIIIETGKKGFGPSWKQDAINALMVEHARNGAHVIRLKSGDPAIFGRLDEEVEVLREAGIAFDIVPGITAASAASASIGQSLTRRGRNSSLRFLTGHDVDGFADHDWRSLAKPGQVAAIYMGKKGAGYFRTHMLAFGANPKTPITIMSNISRADQHSVTTTLDHLADAVARVEKRGPAVILFGLGAAAANTVAHQVNLAEASL